MDFHSIFRAGARFLRSGASASGSQCKGKTLLLLAAAMLLAPAALHADDGVIDFGTMVPEHTYEYTAFSIVKGNYTPTQSGTVKFEYTTAPVSLYSSAAHNDASYIAGSHAFADGKQVMSYELEIGTTYYLYGEPMDSGSLVIHEGEVTLAVTSIIPDPNEGRFSVSSDYRIEVTFNYPVTVGNVFLLAGEDVRERVSAQVSNTTVTCDVANVVMEMYRQGKLNEGDELTLRILQIKDAGDENVKFGDSGKLEIPFTVYGKPGELTGVENADLNGSSVLDSYYFPGDEAAQVRFRFDRELSTEVTPTADLAYGDSDNLDVGVYTEIIRGRNEGNTAYFDLSGKLRRPIDMLPLSTPETQPASLGISFRNIYTPDGQRVYTGMMSNPTGYSVSFRINVLQYNVAADFTPPRGTALRSGQPLEIWVMNGSKIRFDAVCFAYEENGEAKCVEIPASEVVTAADEFSADDYIFTVIVPEMKADAARGIDVTMKNLVCSDGLDHSGDVFGDFKADQAGISEPDAEPQDRGAIYDITGRKLPKGVQPERGFYISNGKMRYISF